MAIQVFTPENTLIVESIKCYLYTDPGIGKSTIAHTAAAPVIFDFDKGQHRVSAELRRGAIVRIDSWLDLENLKDDFYAPYKTIVADTVGAMLDAIKDHLSKNSDNLQRDKTLTLKAQGLAGNLFLKMVRKWESLGKDIVFIAHSVEQESGKDKVKTIRADLAGKNSDLNQLTESLVQDHKYVKEMWYAIQLRAREMGCTFNKEKKRWYSPPEFKGITEQQRDELQDLLDKAGEDVAQFCIDLGIDSLMQIEADKFEAVKADILKLALGQSESEA